MEDANQKPHAIFVPYPFQGHIIPSVNLAIKLASRGFTITFINTNSIHHRISKARSDGDGDDDIFSAARQSGLDIRYTTVDDGLPLEFDRSPYNEGLWVALLYYFSAHVEEAVAKIVRSALQPTVNCLITDTFFVWPSKVAKKFGLKYISFWTEPALVFSLGYHVDLLIKNGHHGCIDARTDKIEYIPGVGSIDPTDLMSYFRDPSTSSLCLQYVYKSFEDVRSADFVVSNTVQELETETISALQAKMRFYSIGPIFPIGFTNSTVVTSLWSESDCTNWLDNKSPGSVLYVSFGSLVQVTKNDVTEIANGLLLSQVNFIWVLRTNIVSSEDTNVLPVGFTEEIRDRGIIVPWCHQRQVLQHRATGGFLTHCGWNSILESIWCEIPFLCFPLAADQCTNRKLIVDDWMIGINLCDDKKRIVTKEEVAEKINHLMSGRFRNEIRKKIKKVKQILENALMPIGSSEMNFDQFIKDLKISIQMKNGGSMEAEQ